MKMNSKSIENTGQNKRFALGPKLHGIACIALLFWTVSLCTLTFTPGSVFLDKGAKISQVASALRSMVQAAVDVDSDYSLHIVNFAVLTLLVGVCLFTSCQSSFRVILLAVAMVVGFSLFTELLQEYLVPGRAAERMDMVADAAGTGAGGLILLGGVAIQRVYIVLRERTRRANSETYSSNHSI